MPTDTASAHTPRIPRTLKAMNGLRGPGALAIAFAHLAVATDLLAYHHLTSALMVVDMFFVFSGIVIAHAYSEKLRQPSAFPQYFLRRLGRIWPLQVATLTVLILYELGKLCAAMAFNVHFSSRPFAADGVNLVSAIPTNLLLIHSLGLHDRETWNFPSWSLSVEFATYILFALLCLMRPMVRHAFSVIAIVGALCILIFFAPYQMRSTFDYGIFRCIAGFLAGTLLYEIATRWDLPKYPFPTFVEFVAVGLFVGWLVLSAETPAVFAAPLIICLFLMILICERGLISRFLSSKPFQILAELSFAIYMVHAIVLIVLLAGLHEYAHLTGQPLFQTIANPLAGRPGAAAEVQVFHASGPIMGWTIALIFFSAVFVAAVASYQLIEVPGRVAFGRLAKRFERKEPHDQTQIIVPLEPMKSLEPMNLSP